MKRTIGSTTSKLRLKPLAIRVYPLLARAIEEGCTIGLRRAHKHDASPSSDAVRDAIEDAVLSEVCELFDFGDPS